VIAVVADDFTGAAEVAAVGLRYGLRAEVQTVLNPVCKADLIVVDTNTRSGTRREAATEVKKVLKRLRKIAAEWIYKKVDSVLRGNVVAELEAALTALGKARAILVPANPSIGRQIRHGHYFVNGKPIDESIFGGDPEYPARSSSVLELLGATQAPPISVVSVNEGIPPSGITVGEASTKTDLRGWAERCDDATVAAGGAEVFGALLEVKGFESKSAESRANPPPCQNRLFVCTSGSRYSRQVVEQARNYGAVISTMPLELLQTDELTTEVFQQWADDTLNALERSHQVLVSINEPVTQGRQLAQRIRLHVAALVEHVLNRAGVDELLIEGGTTASMVVRRLGWERFLPFQELAPGVVRMRVQKQAHLYLTSKPGSYPWPDKIWAWG